MYTPTLDLFLRLIKDHLDGGGVRGAVYDSCKCNKKIKRKK